MKIERLILPMIRVARDGLKIVSRILMKDGKVHQSIKVSLIVASLTLLAVEMAGH